MNTYDINFEYSKKSLGKVPDFKRYINRPPQEKEIIYNEYYKPLEVIFGPMKSKDLMVAFKNQKSRDDLMYRQESIANKSSHSLLERSVGKSHLKL